MGTLMFFSSSTQLYERASLSFPKKRNKKVSRDLKGKRNKTVNYCWSLLNKCNLVKFGKIFTFAYICNFTAELLVFLTYATLKCIRNPLVCYILHLLLIYNTQFRGEKNTTKPDLNHRLLCKTQARNYSKS